MKQISNQRGFTLIELLTVIGILGVIGSIVISIITLTLRGTKKSDLIDFARQNGDTALSQMVKNVRYAKSLDNPTSCIGSGSASLNQITFTQLNDNKQITYACTNNTLTANNQPLIDTNTISVVNCSFSCSQTNTGAPPTITFTYTLQPKISSNFAESNFSIPFQTSVTMRNY